VDEVKTLVTKLNIKPNICEYPENDMSDTFIQSYE